MKQNVKYPKVLYKYLPFNARTLQAILSDEVLYADPTTFNDPLDTKPSVEPDVEIDALEDMVKVMASKRINEQLVGAARAIRFNGSRTDERLSDSARVEALSLLIELKLLAKTAESYKSFDDAYRAILCHQIRKELLRDYDRGVLSLAESPLCPLMWSHYADHHRGICLGYAPSDGSHPLLLKVNYNRTRSVKASLIASLLTGNEHVRAEVEAAVLARKASRWQYEKEWRAINRKGWSDAPYDLVEVTFGLRSHPSVRYAVCKVLEERGVVPKLFEVDSVKTSFRLKRFSVNVDELSHAYPRRWRDSYEAFFPLLDDLP